MTRTNTRAQARLWVVTTTLLALLLSCNGTWDQSQTIPTGWSWVGTGPKVAVVGDSLTWQAEHGSVSTTDPYYERHALTDQLNANGYAARIAARSGADTRSLSMWGKWQSAPDVIVMALGTNDRRYEPKPGMVPAGFPFQLHISQPNVVNYLNHCPNACVVYVGVVEAANRWRHNVYGPYWNYWLRQRAAATNGVFVDWWSEAKAHPEWFTSDLLHHTAAGQAAYRNAITNAVDSCNEAR